GTLSDRGVERFVRKCNVEQHSHNRAPSKVCKCVIEAPVSAASILSVRRGSTTWVPSLTLRVGVPITSLCLRSGLGAGRSTSGNFLGKEHGDTTSRNAIRKTRQEAAD